MSANQARLIEPARRRSIQKADTPEAAELRLPERSAHNRLERLATLALALLREAESLAHDDSFMTASRRQEEVDFGEGINFYGEVERFEAGLIRLALQQAHGNQARAAKLLSLKPTTLNSKIKVLKIEH
jgi:transcriptional regulator with GAF, ATPase, and Fis domain